MAEWSVELSLGILAVCMKFVNVVQLVDHHGEPGIVIRPAANVGYSDVEFNCSVGRHIAFGVVVVFVIVVVNVVVVFIRIVAVVNVLVGGGGFPGLWGFAGQIVLAWRAEIRWVTLVMAVAWGFTGLVSPTIWSLAIPVIC